MSRQLKKIVTALACAAVIPQMAHAAATCVLKGDTVQLQDEKSSGDMKKRNGRDCAPSVALSSIQESINTTGTKLLSPSVLTNTDKLALPDPKIAQAAYEEKKAVEKAELEAKKAAELAALEEKKRREQVWSIKRSDGTLRKTLERWAREANAKMPSNAPNKYVIVWDVPKKFDAAIETNFIGTFDDAVLSMMKSLLISDYALSACFYENLVVRIIRNGDTQSCEVQ